MVEAVLIAVFVLWSAWSYAIGYMHGHFDRRTGLWTGWRRLRAPTQGEQGEEVGE